MCIGSHKTKHKVGSSKNLKTAEKPMQQALCSNQFLKAMVRTKSVSGEFLLSWFELVVRTSFWHFPELRF